MFFRNTEDVVSESFIRHAADIRSQRSSTDKTSGPGKLGRRLDGYSAILQ